MSASIILIIVSSLISIIAFNNQSLTEQMKFYPYQIKRNNEWHRFLSYGFIHGDFFHLFVNMYVLYIFGDVVEDSFIYLFAKNGMFIFIALYFGGLVLSTVFSYLRNKNNPHYSAVGASGAVSSIVFAYIIMFPLAELMIFPLPFRIPAIIFGILYLVYSYFMARRAKDNIGHDAHFFGAIFGLIFMAILDFDFIINLFSLIG